MGRYRAQQDASGVCLDRRQVTSLLAAAAVSACALDRRAMAAPVSERNAGYISDAEHLYARMRQVHPALTRHHSQAEWDAKFAQLRAVLERASLAQFAAGLGEFMAFAQDGHTNLVPFYLPTPGFERLAVQIRAFQEGYFVTGARADLRDALGARVVSIDGVDVADVRRRLERLIGADNPQWPLNWSPVLMEVPLYLDGVGLRGPSAGTHRFSLQTRDGRRLSLDLAAVPTPPDFVSARGDPPAQPHRFSTDRNYDFVHWPDVSAAYVIYAAVDNDEHETIETFANRLFQYVESHDIERLIIDIRENGGGDNRLNEPLLAGMAQSRTNRSGGLFVLTGRATFSAAMNFATAAEKRTHALFVGEPTAGAPNHYGDPVIETLPVTQLPYLISSRRWQDSDADDTRIWIRPDIDAPVTFRDWSIWRDGAIEAVLAYRPGPNAQSDDASPRWRRPSQSRPWPAA